MNERHFDMIFKNLSQFDEYGVLSIFSVQEISDIAEAITHKLDDDLFDEESGLMDWKTARRSLLLSYETMFRYAGANEMYEVVGSITGGVPVYLCQGGYPFVRAKYKDGWDIQGIDPMSNMEPVFSVLKSIQSYRANKHKDEFVRDVLQRFPAFTTGDEVNGADLVDFVNDYLGQKGAL